MARTEHLGRRGQLRDVLQVLIEHPNDLGLAHAALSIVAAPTVESVETDDPLCAAGHQELQHVELGPESIAALVSTGAFTDDAELKAMLKEKVFIDVAEGKVPDAGVALKKSVTVVPKDSLIGTALLKTVTVD